MCTSVACIEPSLSAMAVMPMKSFALMSLNLRASTPEMLVFGPMATVAVSPFSVFTVAMPLSNFSTTARMRVGGGGAILSWAKDGAVTSASAPIIAKMPSFLIAASRCGFRSSSTRPIVWPLHRVSHLRENSQAEAGLFPHQAENLARLAHAAQQVFAERHQSVRLFRRSRELGRHKNRPAQRFAKFFDPVDFIDGGADHGEIQPVGRADIAVEHVTEMQREIDPGGRQHGVLAPAIHGVERDHRFLDGVESKAACFCLIGLVERKCSQHAV